MKWEGEKWREETGRGVGEERGGKAWGEEIEEKGPKTNMRGGWRAGRRIERGGGGRSYLSALQSSNSFEDPRTAVAATVARSAAANAAVLLLAVGGRSGSGC